MHRISLSFRCSLRPSSVSSLLAEAATSTAPRGILKLNRRRIHNDAGSDQSSSSPPRFDSDLQKFMSFSQASSERVRKRMALRKKLKALVALRFGNRYDVEDVSMWQYSHDLQEAPMEFAIVDTESPLVHPLPVEDDSTPYSPSNVADMLLSEGFHGSFVTPPLLKDVIKPRSHMQSISYFSTPWPVYESQRVKELVYPTLLDVQGLKQFTLWTPGPTIRPLMKLLASYSRLGPYVSDTISFLYLWARSHGFNQFTPTCLALMVVHYFRVQGSLLRLRPLAGDSEPSESSKALVLQQFCREPRSELEMLHFELDVSVLPTTEPNAEQKPLDFRFLEGFFRYWSAQAPTFQSTYVGASGLRMNHRSLVFVRSRFPSMDEFVDEHGPIQQNNTSFEPGSWMFQPLVVQDPFVFTYNHAASIPWTVVEEFGQRLEDASRAFRYLQPLRSMLGRGIDLPDEVPSAAISIISDEAYSLYKKSRISKAVEAKRAGTIGRVRNVVQTFSKQYRVEPFGSTCYAIDSPSSDLDLVILDPSKPYGFSPGVKHTKDRVYNMRILASAFKKAGFKSVVCIPKAKVPIVKFVDPSNGLQCDINVNDRLGLLNTDLIKRYCDMLPILRPLVHIIKLWAKPLGLNSPADRQTFSSYALTLMTIGWLQTKGLLPSLQADLPEQDPVAQKGTFWTMNKERPVVCDVRFNMMNDWEPKDADLGEALIGWFKFWGEEFRYDRHMLSIKHGGILSRTPPKKRSLLALVTETKEENERRPTQDDAEDSGPEEFDEPFEIDPLDLDVSYAYQPGRPLYVTDPFLPYKNTTGPLSFPDSYRFQTECVNAMKLLKNGASLKKVLQIEDDEASTLLEDDIEDDRYLLNNDDLAHHISELDDLVMVSAAGKRPVEENKDKRSSSKSSSKPKSKSKSKSKSKTAKGKSKKSKSAEPSTLPI